MLSCAIAFLVVALVAAVLGFSGIAGSASDIALILAVVGLVVAIEFSMGRGAEIPSLASAESSSRHVLEKAMNVGLQFVRGGSFREVLGSRRTLADRRLSTRPIVRTALRAQSLREQPAFSSASYEHTTST